MSIQRLSSSWEKEVLFELEQDQAVLTIEYQDSHVDCIYIKSIETAEFSKLLKLQNIRDARFIGGEKLLDEIQKLEHDELKFSKEIIVQDKTQIIFFPKENKVRFLKQEVGTSEDEQEGERESDLSLLKDSFKQNAIRKKKVLIIDDSKTIQKILVKIIESDENLEVLGVADRPSAAKEIIERERPDLITLDIHMPEMNGVDFLKTYLRFERIPTVMISSVTISEGPLVMEALSNGAQTYIEKPSLQEIHAEKENILEKLNAVASLKEIQSCDIIAKSSKPFLSFDGLIVIGSSTGGTQALQKLLTELPDEIPPILIVQHIPAVFSEAFATRINGMCSFTVKEVEHNEEIKKNTVYIAPGGEQFKVKRRDEKIFSVITDDPPVNKFKPSVDYLFNSIPKLEVENVLGVILTGMGTDGAKGLLKLRDSGAFTIAQDEESSVVFGMPKEAIRLGAACKVECLNNMANEIVSEFNVNSDTAIKKLNVSR